jgi:hypothetical protein
VSLAFFVIVIWYLYGGGLEHHVAQQEITDYEFAKQHSNSRIELCMRAGVVAEAYLSAHDDEDYDKWKAIEREDCAAGGIPNQ